MLTETIVAVSADPRVELLVAQSPGPAGRALLVIHGGPDWDHTYLREPLSELAGQHRLVLPDLRGCGRSTCGLLGFSYSGLLAQRLAVTASARVRRLIIASSSIGPVPDGAFAGWAERNRPRGAEPVRGSARRQTLDPSIRFDVNCWCGVLVCVRAAAVCAAGGAPAALAVAG